MRRQNSRTAKVYNSKREHVLNYIAYCRKLGLRSYMNIFGK